jgi:hypothetical protein
LSDDEIRLRIVVIDKQLERWQRLETAKRIAVYLGLAAFCTLFWSGVIWLLER